MGKEGTIHWVKFAEDVRPYLHQSSVFVLPSYREGLTKCSNNGHR